MLLLAGIGLGALAALVAIVLIVLAFYLVVLDGDEMAALAERPTMSSVVDVLSDVGDEAGAVIIDFPARPAA
jgi:hypothetical protein